MRNLHKLRGSGVSQALSGRSAVRAPAECSCNICAFHHPWKSFTVSLRGAGTILWGVTGAQVLSSLPGSICWGLVRVTQGWSHPACWPLWESGAQCPHRDCPWETWAWEEPVGGIDVIQRKRPGYSPKPPPCVHLPSLPPCRSFLNQTAQLEWTKLWTESGPRDLCSTHCLYIPHPWLSILSTFHTGGTWLSSCHLFPYSSPVFRVPSFLLPSSKLAHCLFRDHFPPPTGPESCSPSLSLFSRWLPSSLFCLSIAAWAFLVAQTVKNLQETQVESLDWGDPLGKGMTTPLQYSCLENPTDRGAWRLHSMVSQRVGHDWATNTFTFHYCCLKMYCKIWWWINGK